MCHLSIIFIRCGFVVVAPITRVIFPSIKFTYFMLITFCISEFVYVSDGARNSKGIELSADAAPFL